MPTEIKQIDDPTTHATTLRVQGEMLGEDAVLLEKIATCMRDETGKRIIIDLADLDFLDSDAAPRLRALASREGFSITGIEVFLQSAVDMAERSEADLT